MNPSNLSPQDPENPEGEKNEEPEEDTKETRLCKDQSTCKLTEMEAACTRSAQIDEALAERSELLPQPLPKKVFAIDYHFQMTI